MKSICANSILIILLLVTAGQVTASPYSDSLAGELNKAIAQSSVYESSKLKRIESLRNELKSRTAIATGDQYNSTLKIYEEYKAFNYDSSFLYVNKLLSLAAHLGDATRMARARLSQSFILLSSGMFKETFESLNTIDVAGLPDSLKAEYYTLTGRLYYDLADYNGDNYHGTLYNEKANNLIDSALTLYPVNSFSWLYFRGLRDLKAGILDSAKKYLEELHRSKTLSLHEIALVTSTLSRIHTLQNQPETAANLLMEAAIADIQSSTKETIALLNLAELFYNKGDLARAAVYIQKANDDAVYYGARQRRAQINPLLQLIQNKKIISVEEQRKQLLVFIAVISFFLLLLGAFAVIILRQIKKLKIARRELIEANNRLSEANLQKEVFNQRLQKSNARLLEADKIKEEYIGYFFNLDSELFLKVDKFKNAIDKKILENKLDDIRYIVNKFNLREEKDDVLKSFDKVFLKLFPDFVAIFNSLFKEEDQVKLKEDQLLNTELRIFALIRMGITENEKIAQILGYSVNTIYTYKTKIKNKSIVPNEQFEEKILQQVQVVNADHK